MKKKSDANLVELTLQDHQNYKFIVKRYEKKLLYYVKHLIFINEEDAQDIIQETFIKGYRNLNGYDPKYKFSSWIFRIAHNEAISFLRKNKYRKREVVSTPENDIFDMIASDLDLEKEYMNKYERKEISSALSKLDPRSREVMILKFIEEMDYNEISDILHIPSGTIGSLISRAKSKLKKLLKIV